MNFSSDFTEKYCQRNLLKLMTCFPRLLCLGHVFDLFLINLWSNGTLHSLHHHHLLLRQLVRQQQTPPPWSHLLPVNFVSNFSSGADWKSCSRKIRHETEKNGRISIDLTLSFEFSLLLLILSMYNQILFEVCRKIRDYSSILFFFESLQKITYKDSPFVVTLLWL